MPSLWDGFEGLGESFKDWGGPQQEGLGQLVPNFGDSMKGLDFVAYPRKDQTILQRMADPGSWANAEMNASRLYPPGSTPISTSIQLNNPATRGLLALIAGLTDTKVSPALSNPQLKVLLRKFPYDRTQIGAFSAQNPNRGMSEMSAGYNWYLNSLKDAILNKSADETERFNKLLELILPKYNRN